MTNTNTVLDIVSILAPVTADDIAAHQNAIVEIELGDTSLESMEAEIDAARRAYRKAARPTKKGAVLALLQTMPRTAQAIADNLQIGLIAAKALIGDLRRDGHAVTFQDGAYSA